MSYLPNSSQSFSPDTLTLFSVPFIFSHFSYFLSPCDFFISSFSIIIATIPTFLSVATLFYDFSVPILPRVVHGWIQRFFFFYSFLFIFPLLSSISQLTIVPNKSLQRRLFFVLMSLFFHTAQEMDFYLLGETALHLLAHLSMSHFLWGYFHILSSPLKILFLYFQSLFTLLNFSKFTDDKNQDK